MSTPSAVILSPLLCLLRLRTLPSLAQGWVDKESSGVVAAGACTLRFSGHRDKGKAAAAAATVPAGARSTINNQRTREGAMVCERAREDEFAPWTNRRSATIWGSLSLGLVRAVSGTGSAWSAETVPSVSTT